MTAIARTSGVRWLVRGGAVLLAAVADEPAEGQHVRIRTQTSISASCAEPGCDCIDAGGAPVACPATEVRNYDSGDIAMPASDSHLATVTGTFVGFDSSTSASADLHGNASFGMLKGFAHTHSEAMGTYVAAGGLAIPGNADAYVSVTFDDYLIAHAATPGGVVSISFGQSTTSAQSAALGGGGLSIDPCLANGDARTQLDVVTVAAPQQTPGGGSAGYDRIDRECGLPQVTGTSTSSFTVLAQDGERVNFGQRMTLDLTAYEGGGLGLPSNSNRALQSDALLDASSTSHLYIGVLTQGASYESGSGTVYETPEADASGGAACAAAALAALRRVRRPPR